MKKLPKNDLLYTFTRLQGNPKWAIITEPLWYIPYSLFSPFATLYMYQLGLSSEEIGITISVGFFLQVIFALIGGVITDKLGRRKTTLIFDIISWTIPCLIWAIADHYYWFLLAAIINASYQITNASWNCLFIEDCPPEHLTNAFTLTHFTGMLSVFASPIAIFYVEKYSLIQAVSILYLISAISMTLKFIILFLCGSETHIGRKRLLETKDISYFKLISGYLNIMTTVFHSSRMLFVLLFMALTNIILISTNSFFALYITQTLFISDEYVAIFPMVRTLVMLFFVILLQNALNRLNIKRSLLTAFIFYLASHILLLITPINNIVYLIFYTILEAIAYAIITPRKEALMAFYVEAKERARIYAIFNTGMIALSAPFGYIIGKLFHINSAYPFVLNIILFILSAGLIMKSRSLSTFEQEITTSKQ